MKQLRWPLSLCLMLLLTTASGCLDRPVYLEKGQGCEVAERAKVKVWIVNKETQKREKRTLTLQPGYAVGRRK